MKKLLLIAAVAAVFTSCNSSADNAGNDTDSGGLTNPTAIDTTKHPSGMVNSSVISTDTAAMNMQNSLDKAKEVEEQKKQ